MIAHLKDKKKHFLIATATLKVFAPVFVVLFIKKKKKHRPTSLFVSGERREMCKSCVSLDEIGVF